MKRRRHTPQQASRKYREAEAALAAGATVAEVSRQLGISAATFHRWQRRYGRAAPALRGRDRSRGRAPAGEARVRDLERENRRLKLLVAELTLENAFLKDALEGKNGH